MFEEEGAAGGIARLICFCLSRSVDYHGPGGQRSVDGILPPPEQAGRCHQTTTQPSSKSHRGASLLPQLSKGNGFEGTPLSRRHVSMAKGQDRQDCCVKIEITEKKKSK